MFQFLGQAQDPSFHFNPVILHLCELESILKILVIKDVLPSYVTLSHIRSFKDLCKYLLFPFLHVITPHDASQLKGEGSSIDCSCSQKDMTSLKSHNMSNNSHQNSNKLTVDIQARAPGLFKCSVAMKFLGEYCNVGLHYVEDRFFKISLINL